MFHPQLQPKSASALQASCLFLRGVAKQHCEPAAAVYSTCTSKAASQQNTLGSSKLWPASLARVLAVSAVHGLSPFQTPFFQECPQTLLGRCLGFLFCCYNKIPPQKGLTSSGSPRYSHHGEEVKVAGAWRSWSHGTHNQEQGWGGCPGQLTHFIQCRIP